ncbi:MAG: hypothetical protein HY690_17760 [Chloroflexi bacterium]|nr:hypothetical protein [Chloroflexota bacterium]
MTPVVAWTTEWVAPYAPNVPNRHWTILEAAPFALSAVADVLARDRLRAVVAPAPKAVPDLLRLFDRPLVLWPHTETYATERRRCLLVPEPERLVVDLYFAVTRRGVPYPENDLAVVLARLVAERDLNIGIILAYARRRRIGSEIASYLRSLDRLPPDVAAAVKVVAGRRTSEKAGAR